MEAIMWVERFSFVVDDGNDIVFPLLCLKCGKGIDSLDMKNLGVKPLYRAPGMPVAWSESIGCEITVSCHGETETAVRGRRGQFERSLANIVKKV
jgi:hypothetical protein